MKQHLLFLSFFLTPILWGQSDPVTIIPFTVENNGICFYCKVNETDSLKFLFDTGANVTVINALSAAKIQLTTNGKSTNVGSNGENEVEQSLGNTIQFGKIIKKDLSLTIIPYETTDFDGVFGSNLMQDHIIEIDYAKNELRFYNAAGYSNKLADYDKLKIYLVNDYPTIKSELTINGKKYKGLFGLDTGASDVLTIASPFAKKNGFIQKMPKIGAAISQGSDGSTYESPMVLLPEIEIGPKSFYRIPILLSVSENGIDASTEMAGFFGNDFLKRFNTVIDFKNGFIYFSPNADLYTEFN